MIVTKTDDENLQKTSDELTLIFFIIYEEETRTANLFMTQYVIRNLCNCLETTHIKS